MLFRGCSVMVHVHCFVRSGLGRKVHTGPFSHLLSEASLVNGIVIANGVTHLRHYHWSSFRLKGPCLIL